MSFIAMRHRHWNARAPWGSSRVRDRLKRFREMLRRPLVEFLEQRMAPAVNILFNFSLDSSGFFTQNPAAKTVLQEAANALGSQLQNSLAAINPSGGNSWVASFNNPSDPSMISIANNLTIPANTIEVFVGAAAIGNAQDGLASAAAPSPTGTADWQSLVKLRGQPSTGYGPWGGSISFDSGTNW